MLWSFAPFLILLQCIVPNLSSYLVEIELTEKNFNYQQPILNIRDELVKKNLYTTETMKNAKIIFAEQYKEFKIDKNGSITLTSRLDREELCPSLNSPSSNQPKESKCIKTLHIFVNDASYFINIIIKDINDHSPHFPVNNRDNLLQFSIKEDAAVGTIIDLEAAEDKDSDEFGVKNYDVSKQWRSGNSDHFQLLTHAASQVPYLKIVQSLDREVNPIYEFDLFAIDGGAPARTGSVKIQINVEDVNDHTPQFDKEMYLVNVDEEIVKKNLLEFRVTDEDSGVNCQIDVYIREPTNHNYFKIVRENGGTIGEYRGRIELISKLDYEKGPEIKFHLVARDLGKTSRSATVPVTVKLNNVNDMQPKITFKKGSQKVDSVVYLEEGVEGKSLVAQVYVTDSDSEVDAITCSISQGSKYFELSQGIIHPRNEYRQYNLYCVQSMDRETISRVVVTVTCSDRHKSRPLISENSLTIKITDKNDNPPVFDRPSYFGQVHENRNGEKVKLSKEIEVSDRDIGNNKLLKFKLADISKSSTKDSSYFRVDDRRHLYTIKPLDYEVKKEYRFLIIAEDHGNPSLSAAANITIKLLDENDHPPNFQNFPYTFRVPEDAKIGSIIGRVNATDEDTFDENIAVRYSIKESQSLIRINSHTGELSTRQTLDREKMDNIHLTVRVENITPLSSNVNRYESSTAETSVVILVENVNDNQPEFEAINPRQPYVKFILEHMGEKNNCEQLPYKVSDKDDIGPDCCDLALENDSEGLFQLHHDASNLICLLKKPTKATTYHLTLTATDRAGNNSLTNKIQITVLVQNDPNPRIPDGSDTNQLINPSSTQITVVAALTSVAGFFCIVLCAVIIMLKRCSYDNTEFEDGLSPRDNVQEDMDKKIPEGCTLLSETGESLPTYYSDDEISKMQNNYEVATTGQLRHPIRVFESGSSLKSNRFSKSCESLEKSWKAAGGKVMLESLKDGKVSLPHDTNNKSHLLSGGYSYYGSPNAAVYHTMNPNSQDNMRVNNRPVYQVIDPFYATRFKHSPEYGRIADYNAAFSTPHTNSMTLSENDAKNSTYNTSSNASKLSDSKKSLRNVYFQTSFV